MRRNVTIAIGLALGAVFSTAGQTTLAEESAQCAVRTAAQSADEVQPTSYYYQASDYAEPASCQSCQPHDPVPMDAMPIDGMVSDGAYGCTDGSCGYDGCDTCYNWWPGDDRLFCGLGMQPCCGGICFEADYLYVRSNFSQSVAYLTETTSGTTVTDEYHNFDFQHESSYRLGGAYTLPGCGEELRFTFTRFNSYADVVIPYSATVIVPYSIDPPPGGETWARADVNVKTYDLDLAKVIPLGGTVGCGGGCGCGCGTECDGSCGCDSCCGCPTWDITWSGGLRFADADWQRNYTAYTANSSIDSQAVTSMNFEGGGVRMGLEGRRYLGSRGIFSMFLRGDLSLLLGNVDLRTEVTDTATSSVIVQHSRNRRVIPVTDIEGGITAQVSCHTKLSAGYLFSAWNDLGMSDQTLCDATALCAGYDDSNLLSFDGMFVRLEACF